MAYIDDNLKLDLLWKRFNGVSQTSPNKTAYEELNLTGDLIRGSEIWSKDNLIPDTPASVNGVCEPFTLRCAVEPSVTDSSAWIALIDYNLGITAENRARDWIPPSFAPEYEIRVYSDALLTTPIFNSKSETNWVFDYKSGILWFPSPETAPTEVHIQGYRYVGTKGLTVIYDGEFPDLLMDPTDNSFADGYIKTWVPNETRVADAIDDLNQALIELLPRTPDLLEGMELTMSTADFVIDDLNVVLSDGFADFTNGSPEKPFPGNVVGRVLGINLETDPIGPFGNGQTGSLSLYLNNNPSGTIPLTYGNNIGINGNLEITNDTSYPGANQTFYQSLTAKGRGMSLSYGLNSVWLNHSETGNSTTLWLVRDTNVLKPTVTAVTVAAHPTESYTRNSSGVPHYTEGSKFNLGATANNLATDIHFDSKNIEFETTPSVAGPNVWASTGSNNLPAVLSKGVSYTATNVLFNIFDIDNMRGAGTVSFRAIARNPNGSHEMISPLKINYIRAGESIDENVPVTETGVLVADLGEFEPPMLEYAGRILLDTGTSPIVSLPSGAIPVWDENAQVPAHEAVVVGGAARFSRENYSTYLPSGPDYSSHDTSQYITYMVQRRAVSEMIIDFNGRHSGIFLNLVGLSDLGRTVNGWMDASRLYAGWGVPGREVDAGCAVGSAATGSTQQLHVTFGYESSSNATDNLILVRFRMINGDKITKLTFKGVE